MRKAKGDQPVHAIPKGVYEGGSINQKHKNTPEEVLKEIATDMQGNGYPDLTNIPDHENPISPDYK